MSTAADIAKLAEIQRAAAKRLPPWRRRRLIKQLESIEDRLQMIQNALVGTPDEAPITMDDEAETAGDWLVGARMDIGDAISRLEDS